MQFLPGCRLLRCGELRDAPISALAENF